jgi:nicotinamidase-related amidase
VGLLANTCLEAAARIGMELGFHITLVRDATSARSPEALYAAMDIDAPTYAQRGPHHRGAADGHPSLRKPSRRQAVITI